MSDTAGWYPDPEGRIGVERWWNGLGWSDSVRPKPGAGPTLSAYAAGPSASYDPYADTNDSDQYVRNTSDPVWETNARRQRNGRGARNRPGVTAASGARSTWIAWVAGVVAVGVLIAVVVVVGGSNDPPATTTTAGLPSSPSTRGPGETRIIDEAAGVAYPYLGAYWLEFDTEVLETTSTAGQFIVTQDVVPNGGRFIAQVTSGPLQPFFQYRGPSSFAATILDVQASVRLHYYPGPNTIETLRDEAITVDGAAAYVLEFDLSWDVPGYDSTGERAALILIETGRSAPAMVYISIPNTHAELYGIVERVIDEIDVLP